MEDDDEMEGGVEEEEKEEKEEKKEDLDETAKFGEVGLAGIFTDLLLKEDEVGNAEEKKLLGFKRKTKKLKKLPLQINQKKNRKREPSTFQKIFDLIVKADVINEGTVRDAAAKYKYQIETDNVNFFLEIGKARASVKKFGFPSNICKNPFHLYTFSPFKEQTSVLTDDRVVWDVIYSYAFEKDLDMKKYVSFRSNSTISTISVITNKTFDCQKAYFGYVQDYFKTSAIINSVPIDGESGISLKNAFNNNAKGIYVMTVTVPSGFTYNYWQYENVILSATQDVTLDDLLQAGMQIKCFNSKNKLSDGLKEIKVQDKLRTYINVHEIKPVDFSPSCLFTEPAIPEVSYFIDAKLDTNTVYNNITKGISKTSNIVAMQIPPNAVFWDNISSFVQMLGLIALTYELNQAFKNEILNTIETYYKNRDIFNSWKRIYKQFESIVISFYDSVTTKLTIDGTIRLEKKALQFVSDYLYLRNDKSYMDIRTFLGTVPGTRLMTSFVSTSGPYELVTSITKLITILKSGKQVKESKIDELFRTIGLMCTRVLFGGDFAMIPKVRSKAAFLGGPGKELTNETIKNNIKYLLDKFKADVKKDFREAKLPDLDYKKMDQLIDKMLDNSSKRFKDSTVSDNFEEIKKQIRSDEKLYDSLREDVNEMYKNGESIEDIATYGDFLDNPFFNSFIVAFKKLDNAVKNNVTKYDPSKIIASLKVAPEAARAKKDKKITKELGRGLPEGGITIDKVLQFDSGKFNEAIQGDYIENGMEKIKAGVKDNADVILKSV